MRRLLVPLLVAIAALAAGARAQPATSAAPGADEPAKTRPLAPTCRDAGLPQTEYSDPPLKPHDTAAYAFKFDQLSHFYRKPGEFTHRLNGDEYGFTSLSFIITETHAGGGPGLHVHDTEEAHVLLEGTAQYRIGNETFTVAGPYVARVPAGTPHTFINAGTAPFQLVAVFGSKHPGTTRIGPNPLIAPEPAACAGRAPL